MHVDRVSKKLEFSLREPVTRTVAVEPVSKKVGKIR